MAYAGAIEDSPEAVLAGLGLMITGMITEATSRARLDYCDVFPQRLFVVPLSLDGPTTLQLEVGGQQMQVEVAPGERTGASLTHLRLPTRH